MARPNVWANGFQVTALDHFTLLYDHDDRRRRRAAGAASRALQALFEEKFGSRGYFSTEDRRHLCLITGGTRAEPDSGARLYQIGDLTIVLFGDTVDDPEPVMESLWTCTFSEIEDVLGRFDGACAGVVIDVREDRVLLFSDPAGQKTLRYRMESDRLIVSSHDIGVFATGALSPSIDMTSLASVSLSGWSIGANSLFKGVSVVKAYEAVTIEGFRASRQRRALTKAIASGAPPFTLDQSILDYVHEYISKVCPARATPTVELSAGFDSRATLGAVLECLPASQITVLSDGPPDSLDVRVAREIASREGLRFENPVKSPPSPERFAAELRYLATATNGFLNANVLATNEPIRLDVEPGLSFSGGGGEIFRGVLYPFAALPLSGRRRTAGVLESLRGKVIEPRSRGGANPLREEVEARLDSTVLDLLGLLDDPFSALDLFYLYDVFGTAYNKESSAHNYVRRLSPFFSRRAMIKFLAYETPRGDHTSLHSKMILRGLKKSGKLPLNGRYYAITEEASRFARGYVDLATLVRKAAYRLYERVSPAAGDLETERAEIAAGFEAEVNRLLQRCLDPCEFPAALRKAARTGSFRMHVTAALSYVETCREVASISSRILQVAE